MVSPPGSQPRTIGGGAFSVLPLPWCNEPDARPHWMLDKTFFDVSEMAGEVLQNFNHLAFEKGVRLDNHISATSQVYADKYLYFVVLNNLLSNAIKFSDRGGTIELFIPDSSMSMTIAVRDKGKGMSMEYARNLFKADVKTSSRGTKGEKGSGLGLIFLSGHYQSPPGAD